MKIIKFGIKLTMLTLCFASTYAQAIKIDNMLKVADIDGKATFTITNPASGDKRIFLNTGIYELAVVDGEIESTAYSRENILQWKADIRPARTIIDPGFEKDFTIRAKCKDECDYKEDKVFKIVFVPTPYVDEQNKEQNVVQMAIGFAALFILPTADKPIEYHATYLGDKIQLENVGKSYLNINLSNCEKNVLTADIGACSKYVTLLAGRKMEVALPESMHKESIDVEISTSGGKYRENKTLSKK